MSDDQILAFVEGRFDKDAVSLIDDHLASCPECGALVVAALHAYGLDRTTTASLSSRAWSLELGTCVAGRYIIRRFLGRGGMGDVFEALDRELQQLVVVKTPRATECDNPDFIRRLRNEARLAGRICHPNVCRVREAGVHEEVHPNGGRLRFVCMDLIDGEPLAQHLRRGPLSFERFRVIGRELLRGVAAIHEARVIHRDIKVHNVMLCRQNRPSVVIIDFGLAVDAASLPETRPRALPRSSQFSIEGSPAYMAPEQFRGDGVTPAADVFAVGVVLFQALTGGLPFLPFRGERKARARRDPDEVPLRARSLLTSVPEPVDAFLARCLDLDARKRYASGACALDGFERALRAARAQPRRSVAETAQAVSLRQGISK